MGTAVLPSRPGSHFFRRLKRRRSVHTDSEAKRRSKAEGTEQLSTAEVD